MSELTINVPTPIPYEGAARQISVEEEARVFHRLRFRMLATIARQTLAASRLRVTLVALLSGLFWLGLFTLFFEAFRFLATYVGLSSGLHADTVYFVYNAFFASLMVMLVFSAGIIIYGGLYRSAETQFLLTLPVRAERIVFYKFQESLIFSSWGFMLLGSPMLVAYGASCDAPWYYYALLLPFMVSFACIPCAVGAVAALLIVFCIPRVRTLITCLAAVAVIGVCGLLLWSLIGNTRNDILTPGWFEETLGRLQFSQVRLLPSWWLSTGLLEAARNVHNGPDDFPLAESIKLLVVLIMTALMGCLFVLHIGGRVLRPSFSTLQDPWQPVGGKLMNWLCRVGALRIGGEANGAPSEALVDRLAMLVAFPLPLQVRLLIVKDLRVFRRDPVQWTQFLIFFGLLALYFVNIRRFRYDDAFAGWVNMVSFLNLAVVGLILSTFTTRFIFPMISLEGSRFWILGLLPVNRDAILWGKFLFAAAGSIIPCTLLILLSDVMLGISPPVLLVHQVTCIVLCVGLSGIAVGLGAKMPDLRERSPSKIAAGFGGTLNLVLSALYIVAVVMLTALPCHFYIAAEQAGLRGSPLGPAFNVHFLRQLIYVGAIAAIFLGALATLIPMRMGFKAFRAMEF